LWLGHLGAMTGGPKVGLGVAKVDACAYFVARLSAALLRAS